MSPTTKRNTQARNESIRLCVVLLLAVNSLLAIASGCDGTSKEQPAATPLRIGLLLNFTGSPEASEDRKRAFDLAIQHINEGGGVLGIPVERRRRGRYSRSVRCRGGGAAPCRGRGCTRVSWPQRQLGGIADFTEHFRDAWHSHNQPFGHILPSLAVSRTAATSSGRRSPMPPRVLSLHA